MPKGIPLTEKEFNEATKYIRRRYRLEDICKLTGLSIKTIQLIKNSEGNYQEYLVLRKQETGRSKKENDINDYDIRDLAKDTKWIKQVLAKIAKELDIQTDRE